MPSKGTARRTARARGFSMVETLVAMVLGLVVLALVFSYWTQTGKVQKTERTSIDMQQAARVAVDELSRTIEQVGFGISRPDQYNPGVWQRSVVYAGAHGFAFNADVDGTRGPIDPSQTLTFPTGETYKGEGASSSTAGAETYVISLDADGDNSIGLDDRTDAASGSFNPAAETPNPLDFAVFRRVHGWDGSAYSTQLAPLTAYLFTGAVSGVTYPDGTVPKPLFVYTLTEDLDGDGLLDPTECVVGTCPPTASRPPKTYLWGDTDLDGLLSNSEISALRTLPVGSPAWSKNKIASSGAYVSTTVTSLVDPATKNMNLVVSNASKFVKGAVVQLDTGEYQEVLFVRGVSSVDKLVTLTSAPKYPHAVGTKLTILPQTLLRAIRSVQVQFTAISPQADQDAGKTPVGRAGRATAHGLDYRTFELQKTIGMANQGTVPLATPGASSSSSFAPACPYTISTYCQGATMTAVEAYEGAAAPLVFRVKDKNGAPVNGAVVTFANDNGAVGRLTSASGNTDLFGMAMTRYLPNGIVGQDKVTASVTCGTNTVTDYTIVDTLAADLTVGQDCLSTVSPRTPTPETSYSFSATKSTGPISSQPVSLHLEVDPNYLNPQDFSKIRADLFVGSSNAGSTDTSGYSPEYATDTGYSGTLTGKVQLVADSTAGGTRVNLVATTPTTECKSYGANMNVPIGFYEFELDSVKPTKGCGETIPCTIAPNADAPEVRVVLSQAGTVVQGADVIFSTTDTHPPPDVPPAASTLIPSASMATSTAGEAQVRVGNNGSVSITSVNPLLTLVDATSTGDPGFCSSGNIRASVRAGFNFEGKTKTASCLLSSDASMRTSVGGKREEQCVDFFNPGTPLDCALKATGIKVAVYATTGGLMPTLTVQKIEGGAIVTSAPSCSTSGKVLLFEKKCKDPDAELKNNERWNFVTKDTCKVLPTDLAIGKYLVINLIKFNSKPAAGSRMDVTLYYDCVGECTADSGISKTFTYIIP